MFQIVWFKKDLRTVDHPALFEAAKRGPVLPLFIVEPDIWSGPDMSARQWDFARECLTELREDLARLGQPLIVRIGKAVSVLTELRRQTDFKALWSHQETGNGATYERDIKVAAWCAANGVTWNERRQDGVARRLKSRDGWARQWDQFMAQDILSAPNLAPITDIEPGSIPLASEIGLRADHCPGRQSGGRKQSLATFASFLTERGQPYRAAMASPLSAEIHCSRLSPYLTWGTLSMREVTRASIGKQRELKEMRDRSGWRGSMSSFHGRLHWRGHFMQKLEDEPAIEFENFHKAYDGLRPQEPDTARLTAWKNGETGLPFVDACMRALAQTGWMNFRMRAMLVATASYHLWLHWRATGEHLARVFTDYEPGIHWSQMQMQSGTTGINAIRIYNPVKQGYDQDPEGVYVRRWLPELDGVPDSFIHEPWKWGQAGEVLGKVYPFPIIDHLAAAKEARQKVWAVRKGTEFRNEAKRIVHKHGSRKSGIPMRGGDMPTGRKKTKEPEQLSLLDPS